MLAEKNPAIDEAVTKIFALTQDDIIREQIEAEELYYRSIQSRDEAISWRDEEIAKRDEEIVKKDEAIAKKMEVIAEKDETIAKKEEEIERLKAIIAANHIDLD